MGYEVLLSGLKKKKEDKILREIKEEYKKLTEDVKKERARKLGAEIENDNEKMPKLKKIQGLMKGRCLRRAHKFQKIALEGLPILLEDSELKGQNVTQEEIEALPLEEVTKVISKLRIEQFKKIDDAVVKEGNEGNAEIKKLAAVELGKLVLHQREENKKAEDFREVALNAVDTLTEGDIDSMTKEQFHLRDEIGKLTLTEVKIAMSKMPQNVEPEKIGGVAVGVLCNFIFQKKKEEEDRLKAIHNKYYEDFTGFLSSNRPKGVGKLAGQGGAKNITITIGGKGGEGIAVKHLQGPPYYNNISNDKGDVNAYEYEDALSCVNGMQERTNEFAQRLLCDGGVVVLEKKDGGKVQYLRDMGNLKVDSTNKKEVKKLIHDSMKKGLRSVCCTMYSGLCEGVVQNQVFNYNGNVNGIHDNSAGVYDNILTEEFFNDIEKEEEKKEEKKDLSIKLKSFLKNKKNKEYYSDVERADKLEKLKEKLEFGGVFKNKISKLGKIINPRNSEEKYLAGKIPSINKDVDQVNKSGNIKHYFENSGTYKMAMGAASFNTKLEGLKYCMRKADNSLGMIRLFSPYLKAKQKDADDKKSSKNISTIVKDPKRVLKAKMFVELIKLEEKGVDERYAKSKKNEKEESKDNKKGDVVVVCEGNFKPEISSAGGGKVKFRIPGQQVISYEEENAAKEEGVSVKGIIDDCADDISTEIHSAIEKASQSEVGDYVLDREVSVEDTRSEELKDALKQGGDEELENVLNKEIDMHKGRIVTFAKSGLSTLYSIEGVDGKKYYPFQSVFDSTLAAILRVNGIMGDSEFSLLEAYFLSFHNKITDMINNPDISDYQKRNYGYRGLVYSSLGFVLSSVLSGIGGENNTWVNLSSGDVRVDVYRSNIFTSFGVNVQIPLPMSLPLIGSNLNIHVIGVNFLSFILGGVILALLPLQKFEDEVSIMINDGINLLKSKNAKIAYTEFAKEIFGNDNEEWLFKDYNKEKGYKGKLKYFFKWCFDRYYSDEREYLENNSFLFVLARRCLFDTLQLLSISIPVVDTYLSININFGTLLISWLIFGGKNKNNEDKFVTNSGPTMGNSPKGPSFSNKNFNINNYGPTSGISFSRIPNDNEVDMNKLEQMKSMMNNNNIQNFSNMGLGNMVPTFIINNNNNNSNNDEVTPVEGMQEKD